MTKYEIILFWSEEDNCFIAEIPELPGCMADGKTYQEALQNAEIMIDEWLETARELGRKIPQPKGRLKFAQCNILEAKTQVQDILEIIEQQKNSYVSINKDIAV